jgi:hypothetical protein
MYSSSLKQEVAGHTVKLAQAAFSACMRGCLKSEVKYVSKSKHNLQTYGTGEVKLHSFTSSVLHVGELIRVCQQLYSPKIQMRATIRTNIPKTESESMFSV